MRLTAGTVQAVVLPALGGRLISLRERGREFVWHDPELLDEGFRYRVPVRSPSDGDQMAAWQNWGGDKSWPAPQAQPGDAGGWSGPPDPVLDGGLYDTIDRSDALIRLRSAVDPRTGLQQTRSIQVHDQGVAIRTTILNQSREAVRFAAWEIMQVPFTVEDESSGFMEVQTAEGGHVVDLGRFWGRPRVLKRKGTLRVGFGGAVAKLGFAGATGRVYCAFADGAELRLDFDASPDAPVASPFQLWIQTPLNEPPAGLGGWRPAHRLIELEPVGPLTDLATGEAASLTASWTVAACT